MQSLRCRDGSDAPLGLLRSDCPGLVNPLATAGVAGLVRSQIDSRPFLHPDEPGAVDHAAPDSQCADAAADAIGGCRLRLESPTRPRACLADKPQDEPADGE